MVSKVVIYVIVLAFTLCWLMLFVSLFYEPTNKEQTQAIVVKENQVKAVSSAGHSKTVRKELEDPSPAEKAPLAPIRVQPKVEPPRAKGPIPLAEIEKNMTLYLQTLHSRLGALAGPTVTAEKVWEEYKDVTSSLTMAWDEANYDRFPERRKDGSIFVSLGTYRDPFCPMTIKSLYQQSAHPEKLFVGLFQQNCFGPKCRTGVLVGGKVEDAGPDIDCYVEFCNSPEGKRSNACKNGNVRLYNVNESESLGPYMARYLGAKFYQGEEYYLQIDSHSEFVKDWDTKLLKMVMDAPAEKPVISTYPPDSTMAWRDTIGFRMCNSGFATSDIERKIIRLGSSRIMDKKIPPVPHYAPFVAAGFFFAPAIFLKEVPFDPFLPWIFMGEEISMSSRLWTAGYDIFSPTINVLNHYYVRRHYPKFWESVNRFFKKPIHNQIVALVIERVKCMLGYPESEASLVPQTVLYKANRWGMGKERSFDTYMKMVGINVVDKTITPNNWCIKGEWPKVAMQYYKK